MQYRSEIDGLRAIAILGVVFFHFQLHPYLAFPGGYLGVDVFFVISGYLISRILFGMKGKGFKPILGFYCRRVTRLLPALLISVLLTGLIGYLALFPDELRLLSKHGMGGLSYIANFLFYFESDYFDKEALQKPFLNLWSLGIEEQFYLFFPFFVVFIRSFSVTTRWLLIILSLFFSFLSFYKSPAVSSFYLPHTRFWELFAGALTAVIELKKTRTPSNSVTLIIQWLALMGIFSSFLFLDEINSIPRAWFVLPVLSTSTLILTCHQGPICRLLQNPVFVFIGLISYPLYLIHWPVLSFGRILQAGQLTLEWKIFALLMCFIISVLIYFSLERPLRSWRGDKRLAGALLSLSFLGILVFLYIDFADGLPSRAWVKNKIVDRGPREGVFSGQLLSCGLSDQVANRFQTCLQQSKKPTLALIGDSKSRALGPGVFETASPQAPWLYMGGNIVNTHLSPVEGIDGHYFPGQVEASLAREYILAKKSISHVVIFSAIRDLYNISSSSSIEGLQTKMLPYDLEEGILNYLKPFLKSGKKIIWILDTPTFPPPEDCLDRKTGTVFIDKLFAIQGHIQCEMTVSEYRNRTQRYRQLMEKIKDKLDNQITLFETTPFVCEQDSEICSQFVGEVPVFSYTDHLTYEMSKIIGKALNEYLHRNNN